MVDGLSNKCFNYKQFYILSKIIASSVGNRFLTFQRQNVFALVCLLFSFPLVTELGAGVSLTKDRDF